MSNQSPWGPFDWEDPFLFNQQLTDEELMVKESVAKYAQDKLAPRV
ncbi:MAG: glutaryl-CoA dehydrogenase, partial [Porticoccaceae bacterium]